MARVSGGTLAVNPNGTNAQIFLQEMTTSATSVSSVNGASGTVVLDTDDISEGSSNLYYTNARARAAISLGSAGSQAYNNSTGVLTIPGTTDHITEGSNMYYTTARWDTKMAAADTDDLAEGSTNLYHQDDLGGIT